MMWAKSYKRKSNRFWLMVAKIMFHSSLVICISEWVKLKTCGNYEIKSINASECWKKFMIRTFEHAPVAINRQPLKRNSKILEFFAAWL